MSPLVFDTAVPFGYLLFYGALAITGVGAVVLFGVGLRRRRYVLAGTALLFLAAVAATIWSNVAADRDLDLNPFVRTDSALVGVWRDGASTLDLRADHTFLCTGAACQDLLGSGTWARAGDFNMTFRAMTTEERRRRFVRYRDRLRLTTVIDDPDSWDGSLTFGIATPRVEY
jgi:hypothetical protein